MRLWVSQQKIVRRNRREWGFQFEIPGAAAAAALYMAPLKTLHRNNTVFGDISSRKSSITLS
jgi:hypothetical protein